MARADQAAQVRRRLAPSERRAEILAAAQRVFAHRPPELVSIEEIAAAAGASPALVHHYFGTKQKLVELCLRAAADELIALLQVDRAVAPAAALGIGLARYLDYLAEHPRSWSALLRAANSTEDPTSAIAAFVDHQVLADALARLLPDGHQPPPTLVLALRGWLALLKDGCLRWIEDRNIERAALEKWLAAALEGCLESAAAVDPRVRPVLDQFYASGGTTS